MSALPRYPFRNSFALLLSACAAVGAAPVFAQASSSYQFYRWTSGLVVATGSPGAPVAPDEQAGALELSTSVLSFGSVDIGDVAIKTVELLNTSNVPVSVGQGISTTGTGFSAATSCGASLAAGASCLVEVSFSPMAEGPLQGSLTVASNASNSPAAVSLNGSGVQPTLGLFFEGADGSTTILDSSGRTLSTNGGVSLSAAHAKSGNTGALFSSGVVVLPSDTQLNLPGDFTISMDIKPSSFVGSPHILSNGTTFTIQFDMQGNGRLIVWDGANRGNVPLPLNQWSTISLARSGANLTLAVNGSAVANWVNSSSTVFNLSGLALGARTTTGTYFYSGAIDNFKVRKP